MMKSIDAETTGVFKFINTSNEKISIALLHDGKLIRFSQNGKVGIGTTAPKARLHVTDSSVVFSAGDPLLAVPGITPINGTDKVVTTFCTTGP